LHQSSPNGKTKANYITHPGNSTKPAVVNKRKREKDIPCALELLQGEPYPSFDTEQHQMQPTREVFMAYMMINLVFT